MMPKGRRRRFVGLLLVSLAAIAAVAWIAGRFKADMTLAYARLATGSRMIETACGPIEYAIAGRSGPSVLLVHGAGGGFDQGLQFGAPLVRAGFTVIAPSRFGYLRTPVPRDVTPVAQADAHVCLLDALRIKQVAAFGGSAGAPSVLQLCLRHPERCSSMVLVVPAIFLPERAATTQPSWFADLLIRTSLRSDFMFWVGAHALPGTLIRTVLATPMEDVNRASSAERERVFNALEAIAPIRPRARGLAIDASVTTAPSAYELEKVAVPTLIAATRNDGFHTLTGALAAAQHIHGAKLVVFDDGGHLWVGHEAELWSAVGSFLRAAPPPNASRS